MITPPYGAPATVDRGPRPVSLNAAFVLMLVGAGFEVIGLIVALATKSDVRHVLINDNYSGTKLDSALAAYTAEAIIGAFVRGGLWIWMAFANRGGRRWARITSTVFFGLDTLGLLVNLGLHASALDVTVAVVGWAVIALPTVVLLWQRDTSAYIARLRPPRY
jgi:hypothetical protein